MSNLKPAPLALDETMVAKLVGARPAYGKGIVRVPIAGRIGEHERPEKIDPRTIPSSMELLAQSWRRRDDA